MIQMVKVLEVGRPAAGYMAEVPGSSGRFVHAESIPQLRSRLLDVIANPDAARSATFASPMGNDRFSSTDLYLKL